MEKRRRAETAGDLGPFAAALTLRQVSPPTTQYKKLQGTKNNSVHVQLGQIMNKKIQKDQNPTATSGEVGSKAG